MTAAPVLELRGVRKEFPGLVAVDDVDLEIHAGEVHALAGENGAGKSTLIKIVAGALTPSAGTVKIGGTVMDQARPAAASALGVAVIHQERQIGLDLTVCENVLLGRLPSRVPGVVNWPAAYRRTEELLARVNLDVDPRTPARELRVSQHQTLEIARALAGEARLMIMDEPTASLSPEEADTLFSVVRSLRDQGQAVIYISHHLNETFRLADNVTVLRDGKLVGTYPTSELDPDRLTSLMFGRDMRQLERSADEEHHTLGAVAISARDVRLAPYLNGVSFEAQAGEIVCVAGGIGSGRSELARCLAGADAPERGEVRVGTDGPVIETPRQALKVGVGFLPADRKLEGLLTKLDVVENVDLIRMTTGDERIVLPSKRSARVRELADGLSLRYRRLDQSVEELSGGNQQKVLLARLLAADVKVLILDEPTAGVDVSTKLELYELLKELARGGVCVVACSSDFEEIKLLADRVLIMHRGRIVGDLSPDILTEEQLLLSGDTEGSR